MYLRRAWRPLQGTFSGEVEKPELSASFHLLKDNNVGDIGRCLVGAV